jgi:hypothetical protein
MLEVRKELSSIKKRLVVTDDLCYSNVTLSFELTLKDGSMWYFNYKLGYKFVEPINTSDSLNSLMLCIFYNGTLSAFAKEFKIVGRSEHGSLYTYDSKDVIRFYKLVEHIMEY